MEFSWRPGWSRDVPPYIVSRQGQTLRCSTSTSKLTDTQYHTVNAFLLDGQVLSERLPSGYCSLEINTNALFGRRRLDQALWDGLSDLAAADGVTGGYLPC